MYTHILHYRYLGYWVHICGAFDLWTHLSLPSRGCGSKQPLPPWSARQDLLCDGISPRWELVPSSTTCTEAIQLCLSECWDQAVWVVSSSGNTNFLQPNHSLSLLLWRFPSSP